MLYLCALKYCKRLVTNKYQRNITHKTIEIQNGLAQCLERYKNTVSNLMFPRCYYVRGNAGYNLFMEDYITTALTSTLKIIVQSIEENKMMLSENGQVRGNSNSWISKMIRKHELNNYIFFYSLATVTLQNDWFCETVYTQVSKQTANRLYGYRHVEIREPKRSMEWVFY